MKYIYTVLFVFVLVVAAITVGCNSDDDSIQTGLTRIDQTFLNPTSYDTVNWLPREMPTARITYIPNNSLAYGDLRIPKNNTLKNAAGYPVIVMIHGGAWTAGYSLDYVAPLTEALTDEGIATWNIEYRRIENTGGKYPNTFLDVAAATDYLNVLALTYELDLSRVIIMGHSSGGHLALWVGNRVNIPVTSPLYNAAPLPVKGVVSLAGIPNLEDAYNIGGRNDVLTLLDVATSGGAIPLYPATSPYHMLGTGVGVPTSHIVGTLDNPWRVAITRSYVDNAILLGDPAHINVPVGANHFDVVDPCGPAWPTIVTEVFWALGETPPGRDLNYSKFCPVIGR